VRPDGVGEGGDIGKVIDVSQLSRHDEADQGQLGSRAQVPQVAGLE
jgi:hypothetical protein